MQPAMIKAVLFDFGGVVADEGFREGLRFLASHHGRDPAAVLAHAMDAVYDSGYVTGRGSEAEFWRRLGELSGLWVEPLEGEHVILARFRLRPWILDWVRRLRGAGLVVGLLTDQTDWLARLDRRDRFLAEFEPVFNSYQLGKGKRDPSLFDDVAANLGLGSEQILFVDDDPGNIERARERGWATLLFQDREATERVLRALLAARAGR